MKTILSYIIKSTAVFSAFFLLCSQKVFSEFNAEQYLLNAGDEIYIEFEGLEIFSKKYQIQPNGDIFLPEIGLLSVENKTIKELQGILNQEYRKFIYEPEIELFITNYRPAKVTLRGEVNKTGLYEMPYYAKSNERLIFKAPTLFDIIQSGEGLTAYSDLSNIEVTRKNPEILGGGKLKTSIDLIELLENGNQSQNLILLDGDDIFVPRNENLLIDQLINLNSSNITPSTIEVFVNGNVFKPGRLLIKQGSSLYEAISAAGGRKFSHTGNVEFIRLNRNGDSEKRKFRYNDSSKKGSYKNPILLSGDIVYLNMNIFGRTTKAITEFTAPVVNSYGIYKIFSKD